MDGHGLPQLALARLAARSRQGGSGDDLEKDGKRSYKGPPPYDLRHTCASLLLAEGPVAAIGGPEYEPQRGGAVLNLCPRNGRT